MVGFLRKKKSDRAVLSGDTVLDRKGKVDNASLLDGDGEPTEGTLYDVNGKRVNHHNQRKPDEEKRSSPNPMANAGYPPVLATGTYPPQQQQPPGVYGYANNNPPQQYGQPPQQQYGQPPQQQYGQPRQHQYGQPPHLHQYGQPPLQQQQYGQPLPQQQYGQHQQQQYPPTTLGGQYQYPVRYGQTPPPMPSTGKRSRFRLPSIGKKS